MDAQIQKLLLRFAKDPGVVITLVGSYPFYVSQHENHPFITKCLKMGLPTYVLLIDPIYQKNPSGICEDAQTIASDSQCELFLKKSEYGDFKIILVRDEISDAELSKLDDDILSHHHLHFITYYTGFDVILGKEYHPRRYESNGGCMLNWHNGLSSQQEKYDPGKITQNGYFLPNIDMDTFTFVQYELCIESMYELFILSMEHPTLIDESYFIGTLKLILYYLTQESLPFRGFSSSIISYDMDLCDAGKYYPIQQKCSFNKSDDLVILLMSIYTLFYRRNMIRQTEHKMVPLEKLGIDTNKFKSSNKMTFSQKMDYMCDVIDIMTYKNLPYNQRLIVLMIKYWLKSDEILFKTYWYKQMNDLCNITFSITDVMFNPVDQPLMNIIEHLDRQLEIITQKY